MKHADATSPCHDFDAVNFVPLTKDTPEEQWIELVRRMVDGREFKAPGPHSDPDEWVQMPWHWWVAIDRFVRDLARYTAARSTASETATNDPRQQWLNADSEIAHLLWMLALPGESASSALRRRLEVTPSATRRVEPVAWMRDMGGGPTFTTSPFMTDDQSWKPLYAAPQGPQGSVGALSSGTAENRPHPAVAAPVSATRLPDVLFDGFAVYNEMSSRERNYTTHENVSAVLDAVVRLLRREYVHGEKT